jgi:hypothetical protein
MPPGRNWPKRIPARPFSRRHQVEIRFGDPVTPGLGRTAREVMDEVKSFWDREGLAPEQVEQAPIVTPAPVAERVREPVA